MSDHPNRKWVRLREYDYSTNGAYFVTICTKEKKHILSTVIDHGIEAPAEIRLSEIGMIAESYIRTIPGIDKYVIMPNHVHMIIIKNNGKPLSSDIRSFKGLTTKKAGNSIWQDYYYDHVIRNETDYQIKWKYIDDNPAKWASDEYYGTDP